MSKKTIFISYSHKDEEWKDKLLRHLKVLELEGHITLWDDRKLNVGDQLFSIINEKLNSSNIAVLLITADFLISDFIRDYELPIFLKRFSKKDLLIIPVIIKPCIWGRIAWLKKINAFPKDGIPITSSLNSDSEVERIFSELADIIYKIANDTKERKRPLSLNYFLKKKKQKKFKQIVDQESRSMSISPDGKLQLIKGDNNIQVGGDYITYESQSTKRISVLPPPESIGADSLLKQRIQSLFNQIGEARGKRFGKKAYSVMYKNFKTDFGIKGDQAWTVIWTWPKNCSISIVQYLEKKYSNTIKGRIEIVSTKINYIPSRPKLYELEQLYLSQINLDIKSEEVKISLKTYFGVDSHTKLNQLQHWLFVNYLEALVKTKIGE